METIFTFCRQSYHRKAEKRPHSRSASEDSGRERRRSLSPKRRRRDSPPASTRGVYKRRSPSRESRYSDDRRDSRSPRKHKKGDGASLKDIHHKDKRDRHTDEEEHPPRYHHRDHSKPKRRDSPRRRQSRSPSRSRSRSRTPRSRSRSLSRSSSRSRGRGRGDAAVPARRRSPSLSRSRSPPSPHNPASVKLKAQSMKHVSCDH